MGSFSDHDYALLRRRVVAKLRPLAEFFGVDPQPDTDDGIVEYTRLVADRAADVALTDDDTLAGVVESIDKRFDTTWPSDDKARAMLRQATSELREVAQALDDYVARPELRSAVVEEIGDAMLALARLALTVGCKHPLEPLGVACRKTVARLRHFETLLAAPNAHHFTKGDMWKIAKQMAAAGKRPGESW